MKLKLSLLLALILLAGCSTAPSLEDQAKLVEYEKCLDFYSSASTLLTQSDSERNLIADWKEKTVYKYDAYNDYKKILEGCESYRP